MEEHTGAWKVEEGGLTPRVSKCIKVKMHPSDEELADDSWGGVLIVYNNT